MAIIKGTGGRQNLYQFGVTQDIEKLMGSISQQLEGVDEPGATLQRSVMLKGAQALAKELNDASMAQGLSDLTEQVSNIESSVAQILNLLQGDPDDHQ